MRNFYPHLPVTLTIAGSDSGGGAGIQADLKTFSALGVFGTSAITAITAQNPDGVYGVQGLEPTIVAGQIRAVTDYFEVGGVKVGMVLNAAIISAVAEVLKDIWDRSETPPPFPLVLDPVMVSSSGEKLLDEDALDALCKQILPMATLVTPNMAEAAILSGQPVEQAEQMEQAARAIFDKYKVPVLVKGGHLKDSEEAVDCLWDGEKLEFFGATFLHHVGSHGTGCTLSSAITVNLQHGYPLPDAVAVSKEYLHRSLGESLPSGKGMVLNHAFAPLPLKVEQTF